MSPQSFEKILIFSTCMRIIAPVLSHDVIHQLEQKVKSQQKNISSLENTIKKLDKKYQGIVERLHATKSCTILKGKQPSAASGKYTIHPEGLDSPVTVHCDMASKNGIGVTEIGHDSESRTHVSGYEAPGAYKRNITYDLKMKQVVAIIHQSQWCEQFIKYECQSSTMWLFDRMSFAWWVSRQGSRMNYWGGAEVNSGKCACGMTNTCAGGGRCNCSKNDLRLREDSGYLTDKNTLPVTQLRFGDTGSAHHFGYHTLGKLRCWD